MKRALLLAAACACAAPAPRPPAPVTARAGIQQIQVGWIQVPTGQPDRPIVEDLRHGRAPDEREARETAEDLLARCRAGAAMEPLQEKWSEVAPGTVTVDAQSRLPFRDLALSLQPGECALFRSRYALHVIKRVN